MRSVAAVMMRLLSEITTSTMAQATNYNIDIDNGTGCCARAAVLNHWTLYIGDY